MTRANASRASDGLSDEERRWFARALGMADLNRLRGPSQNFRVNLGALPFSNIVLGKIGARIYDALKRKPRQGRLAAALADTLQMALQARGVPKHVRDRYRRQLHDNERACSK